MTKDETTADLEQQDNEVQEGQDTQETQNEETQEEQVENQDQTQTETVKEKDWKAEALKYKAILDRNKDKKEPSKKSDDFGYDVKAYLKASGIDSSEFDFVKTELKESGLKDLDRLLENDYFKSRLESHRELTRTKQATPKGNRSGQPATDSVEYWMSKPMEEVPTEMRIKVVNAKLAKENNKGVFYDK